MSDRAEELRHKYAEERTKRLRPDGNDQYLEPTGRFAYLMEDPYTPRQERPARRERVEVAVIGGGFGGLVAAARLVDAGVRSLAILDGAGDFGGVWYWNRYPGAMCDTASMVYLPLLEETGYLPSAKYVEAPEIKAHAERIARHYGLYDHAWLSTEVRELRYDGASQMWTITTDRGDELIARFVVSSTGPLHRPKLPGIAGIETFAGPCFHTSRWDYVLTGGSPEGDPMDRLAGLRVGIIGTGATAVQCIPKLARDAGELYVFQRTPSSIDVRNNHRLDPDTLAALEPGWQDRWRENFAVLQTGGFAEVDLVQDGWTDIAKRIRDRVVALVGAGEEFGPHLLRRAYEECDDEKMDEIRQRVHDVVSDPSTAEALMPWYRQLCKRPCFHDEYLDTFNLDSVHLVDTDGQGVAQIDETGVVVNGEHIDLDVIVFASGFEVGTPQARRSGFETYGRDGVALSDHWSEGMRSLHGIHVAGFPNLFLVGLSQGGNLLSNVTHNLVEAANTVALVVAHARSIGATEVAAIEAAESAWVDRLMTASPLLGRGDECTPGYYNNEGQPVDDARSMAMRGYPGGPPAYFDYIRAWRQSGTFDGLSFSRTGDTPS